VAEQRPRPVSAGIYISLSQAPFQRNAMQVNSLPLSITPANPIAFRMAGQIDGDNKKAPRKALD
jgi:hypothetical protein